MDGRDLTMFDPRRTDFHGVIRFRVPARELLFVGWALVVVGVVPLAGYVLTGGTFWGLFGGGVLGVAGVVVAERFTRRLAWGRPRAVTVEVVEEATVASASVHEERVAELVEFAPGVVVEKVRHTAA